MANITSPLRSLLWSGLETIGTVLIGLLSVIVIARLIGPSDFGLAAIGLGLTLVFIVFISSLVHDGLVRSPDYSDRQLNSAFTFSLLAGIAAAAGLGLLAQPLAGFLDEPGLAWVLLCFLPMVLLGALTAPLIAERRRMLDFRTLGRQQLLTRSIGLAIGIALAAGGGGVWSVVAQQLTASGLLFAMLTIKRRGLPRLRIDWRALQPILQFSQYIAWSGLVVQLTERLFLTLVGYLYGLNAAGQWAVASRLVETITIVLSQLLYHVALAHMAPFRAARAKLAEIATLSRDMLILVALPGLVAVVAAIEPLVALLFGEGWADVPGLIAWMLLGSLFVLRRLFAHVALNVLGRSGTTFAAFSGESGTALALLASLSPLGVMGAALARGLSFAVGWLVIFHRSAALLGMRFRAEVAGLAVDVVVAVAAVSLTAFLLRDVAFGNDVTAILCRGALAGGLALASLALLRLGVTRQLITWLREAIRER